jgi:single-stranded-DNA-specific exonuclease
MKRKNTIGDQRERWHFVNYKKDDINKFADQYKLDPLIAKLLMARDLHTKPKKIINEIINPSINLIKDFSRVSSPEDIKKACDRIFSAIDNHERIMINGDPDADGITGTSILVAGLRELGADVLYEFPTRSKEGHGLQPKIIDRAKKMGCKLIITADCGSRDVYATEYAIKNKLDVIICDHHILGNKKQPRALAMVNPYRHDDPGPFKKLSGAGVALKLVLAVFDRFELEIPEQVLDFLVCLAMLGTISDRMSLQVPMNRMIIKHGVSVLNKIEVLGLKELRDISVRNKRTLRPRDIARTVVPRLNAPGRIGDRDKGIMDSKMVVDLLLMQPGRNSQKRVKKLLDQFKQLWETPQQDRQQHFDANALESAAEVDDINEKRKKITSKIEDEIDIMIQNQVDKELDRIIIVQGKNWNSGVIGIDTDRLKDRFLRPAMILTHQTGSEYVRGSVRSIPRIDMYSVINAVSERFEDIHGTTLFKMTVELENGTQEINAFGGHAQACGFTLLKSNLDEFLKLVRQEMTSIPPERFRYSYEILDTLEFDDLSPKLVKKLDKILPYGQEFEYPIFYLKGIRLGKGRAFGNKYQEARTPHVDFEIVKPSETGNAKRIKAVGFGLFEKFSTFKAENPNGDYDVIVTIDYDDKPRGRRGRGGKGNKGPQQKETVRLSVQDIRPSK